MWKMMLIWTFDKFVERAKGVLRFGMLGMVDEEKLNGTKPVLLSPRRTPFSKHSKSHETVHQILILGIESKNMIRIELKSCHVRQNAIRRYPSREPNLSSLYIF